MVITMKMEMDLLEQKYAPSVMVPRDAGNCRMLEMTLTEGGEPWEIPEKVNVRLHYRKPDGTGGVYDTLEDGSRSWEASGNLLTVALVPQMFTAEGNVAASVEFILGEKRLNTFGFWIQVMADCTLGAADEEDYINWASWTYAELDRMLAEIKNSGAFDGATGPQGFPGTAGYTPIRGVDYWTQEDQAQITAAISQEIGEQLAEKNQLAPAFVNSVSECVDPAQLYVLPDGYIYAYLYSESSGPSYTNLAGAVQENTRQNSSAVAKELAGAITTGFIPVKQGDTIRVKGFNPKGTVSGNYPYICFFTGASEGSVVATDKFARSDGDLWTVNGDVYEYTPFKLHTGAEHSLASSITHIRINGAMTGSASDVIVTVNQEIVESTAGGYAWTNTGHAFVPGDYEGRIIALENTVQKIQSGKKWDGKKWVVVGDSLTQALNSDGTNANTDKYYHTHIAEETGISVVNMGQGGTGYKKTDDSGYAFYQRIVNVPTDADVVTILGSINDLSRTAAYTIGEPTDTGTDTVCGCINTTLDNLFAAFPLANVGIITPMPTKYYNYRNFEADTRTQRIEEYCDKLMEICRRRSIPVLDMFRNSGLRPWDKAFRDALYTKEGVEGDGELAGIHLDENGHKLIAAKIKAFLNSLMT